MAERYRVVERHPLRYLLSVPPGTARPGERFPLLCFLHGYGEAAPRDIHRALSLHGPLRSSSAARARQEFIVVAPQLLIGGDLWGRYADVLRQIVSEVRSEHGGDPWRLYLTGFSFGANGVFDLGAAQADLWAAKAWTTSARPPRPTPTSGSAAGSCPKRSVRRSKIYACRSPRRLARSSRPAASSASA